MQIKTILLILFLLISITSLKTDSACLHDVTIIPDDSDLTELSLTPDNAEVATVDTSAPTETPVESPVETTKTIETSVENKIVETSDEDPVDNSTQIETVCDNDTSSPAGTEMLNDSLNENNQVSIVLEDNITEISFLETNKSEDVTNPNIPLSSQEIIDNQIAATTSVSSESIQIQNENILGNNPVSDVTSTISNDTKSPTPNKVPEIPSVALMSGIFLVIGGLMIPKK